MDKKNIYIFGLIILTLIVVLSFFLKTEIEISKVARSYEIINEKFIYQKDNEIKMTGFNEKINNLNIEENKVFFDAKHQKYGYNRFFYDLMNHKFYFENIDKKTDKEDGFNDIIENKVKILNENKLYKKSKDNSKIVFINKKGKIKTYDKNKDQITTIEYKFDDITLDKQLERITISPKGGYLAICENKKIFLYGADSGYLYGKDISGIQPYFINDSTIVYKNYIEKYKQYKLAKFSAKNKKIKYFYETTNNISSTKYSYLEKIVFFETKDKKISNIIIFNQKNNTFISKKVNSAIYEILFKKDKVILVYENENSYNVNLIDLKSLNEYKFKNINKINNDYIKVNNKSIIYKIDNQYILKKEDEIIYLTDNSDELLNIFLGFSDFVGFNFKNKDDIYIELIKINN
ncbi:MAG: hypothetical protein ACQEQE_04420 [Bacillota bacterium]